MTEPAAIDRIEADAETRLRALVADGAAIAEALFSPETDAAQRAAALHPETGRLGPRLRRLYEELETRASSTEGGAILDDPAIHGALPQLYALRAAQEAVAETALAHAALTSPDPQARVAAEVRRKIDSLPAAFFDALSGAERLLFIGSGPLPTTAMALVETLGRPVRCLDFDAAANRLGAAYVEAGGYRDRIAIAEGRVEVWDGLGRFDAIVCAFLVGIGTRPEPAGAKSRLVERVLGRLAPGQSLLLRTPYGLGALLYPVLSPTTPPGIDAAHRPGDRYDRGFVLYARVDGSPSA